MTDKVLGGSIQTVYDVSGLTGWTFLGGEPIPVYIEGTGAINGDIVPPVVPDLFPLHSLAVDDTDWLAVNGVDHLIVQ